MSIRLLIIFSITIFLLTACAARTLAPLPLLLRPRFGDGHPARYHPNSPPHCLVHTQARDQPVTVTACAEDGTGDTVIFNELLEALTPALNETDSYRYRTLYRYTDGGRYVDDVLSVELEGVHTGLLAAPEKASSPSRHSPTTARMSTGTDLRSGSRTETIVTEDGFWVLGPDEPGWVAFNPATPADFTQLREMFPPLGILFTIGGGGSLYSRSARPIASDDVCGNPGWP